MIAKTAKIGENVKIGDGVDIQEYTIISDNVEIGNNVKIGNNVVIYPGVKIEEDSTIEHNVVLGYNNLTKVWDKKIDIARTLIGKNVLVRTFSTIYTGCKIGDFSMVNHNVILREGTEVGKHTSIGCLVKCEGYTVIGNFCSIHAQNHLTSFMKIEDYVFMGPNNVTANDNRIDYKRDLGVIPKGPTIKFGARIACNVTLLPGITIGREAFIGANALVNKDIPDFKIAAGAPVRIVSEVPESERLKVQDA